MRWRLAWSGLFASATLALAAPAQGPRIEVAFSASAATSGLPAVSWLCGTVLPMRPEWPSDLKTGKSFVVSLDADGLTISPNEVDLPVQSIAVGSVDLGGDQRALCSCLADGTEDWYVPEQASPPQRYRKLLYGLRAHDWDRAHSIDAAIAAGHLLGATTHDPKLEVLQVGAALCGTVTWQAWRTTNHVRVRGRSDGGLLLPAILLALADLNGVGAPRAMPFRAFVARDGEREEAVRQMARAEVTDRETLHSMLFGNDEMRLTAIDCLVRLDASGDLPRIIAAATPTMPLAAVAAGDAITALWADASPTIRARTREAMARSQVPALRSFEPPRLSPTDKPAEPITVWQAFMWLSLLFACVFTFWLRERQRLCAYV